MTVLTKTRLIALTCAAVAVGAMATIWVGTPSSSNAVSFAAAQAQSSADEVDTSMIRDMVLGEETAPVTVVEYASFTCPHCATFHKTAFQQIKENYIDTGKVKFVYREVYFDRFGLWAGMVARCGDGQRYFGIADMIYDQQREWTAGGDPAAIAENLQRIGRSAGLGEETLQACMQDADKAQALYAFYQKNAEADNIRSTPSFIVDGQLFSNMSYADFSALLDKKLGG